MHEVPLLINITLALVVAFFGGILARRLKLPAIVGYLLAGIVIGPFTPGYVGDVETIQQLAELGVIFLLFGVGLHFSFQDLWRVKDIAIPGALIQTTLATLLGVGLTQLWGWSLVAGVSLGLAISVASTVVLLRGLMDNNLLNTPHGQAAIGWLVMEDILSVIILVIMPAIAPQEGSFNWSTLLLTLVKAAAFGLLMFFGGSRLIPWALKKVASMQSREMFILAVLAITLGTALGAAYLFGVSLALGAFVAGAIVSQSHLSHQVGADVFSFREAFAVLFFVSVGMLVNPMFLWQNIGQVLALTILIVIGKGLIVLLMGLFFPRPARTFLVVAVGLSQIGEFSFILGQAAQSLGMLDNNQYSLILAGALLSITLNPLMFRLLPVFERGVRRMPGLWKQLDTHIDWPQPTEDVLQDHVVIVGYGRVGKHLVDALGSVDVRHLVIEGDTERIDELNERKILTLYGDAANSEVISHAGLKHARMLVVAVPDESDATLIVSSARAINPDLPIIVRAETEEGGYELVKLGAHLVVQPELEGSLEMLNHTLLDLGFPLREVHDYVEGVRQDYYAGQNAEGEHPTLRDLLMLSESLQISWVRLEEGSPMIGRSLRETDLRAHTGASVVAIRRGEQLMPNPKSSTVFELDDRVGLIGEAEQIEFAEQVIKNKVEV